MGEIGLYDSIFFISFLVLLALAIRLGKDILGRETKIRRGGLTGKEKYRTELSRKLGNIKQEKAYLEEKLTSLSKLYTIMKEMSFDIRFKELFNSLKNFLEDNFRFGKFKIVLFKYKDSERSINKVYEISAESANFIEPDRALSDLADFVTKSKKPKRTGNTLAIPLIARRRVISAILIEDTKESDYGKFLILAPQIAMEIERVSLFDSVESLSIMDGLTGTFLRRYFLERLAEEVKRAKQSRMNLSFIMADLDYFKKCNDNFGHLVGDVVLKEVADILKKNVREIDLVGRFGGEEFCMLLPEADKAGAYLVGERIRKAVENHTIKAYDESVRITVSLGISSFPENSKSLDELIENADKALYEAKEEGRNRVSLAS